MPRRPKRHVAAPEVLTYSEFYAPSGKEPPAGKKGKKGKKTVRKGPYIPLTDRIVEAVKELGSPRGVSFIQIKKYLDSKFPCSPDANPATIRRQQKNGLDRAIEAGVIRGHALHPTTRFVRSKRKTPKKTKKDLKATSKPKAKKARKATVLEEPEPSADVEPESVAPTKGRKAAKKAVQKPATKKAPSGSKLAKKAEELDASHADPASGIVGEVHGLYSCSLKKINLAENMDKYYIMQILEKASGNFAYFTRWGRTGAAGQSKTENYSSAKEAEEAFEKAFKEKTGNTWGEDFVEKTDKYKLIVANDEPLDDDVCWQYWVDDGVDGKANGWYNYTDDASETVESIYQENTRNSDMEVRCVQSGSFSYRVDFKTMTQTNLTHSAHKQRKIRRGLRSENN